MLYFLYQTSLISLLTIPYYRYYHCNRILSLDHFQNRQARPLLWGLTVYPGSFQSIPYRKNFSIKACHYNRMHEAHLWNLSFQVRRLYPFQARHYHDPNQVPRTTIAVQVRLQAIFLIGLFQNKSHFVDFLAIEKTAQTRS